MNKHIKESDIIPKPITVLVTLDQLIHGSEYPEGSVNSRKAYREQDIEQLAHSLLPSSDGQLKPLLCCTHKATPNKFYVFDGGRRETSFAFAIANKLLPPDHPIEIKDYGQISPALALQLSMAANEQVPLHPADRAEVFAKLSAAKSAEQIAEERGMSVQSVKQSIALGSALAPEAIQLWRADKIGRDDVAVLVLGDVEQQQKVLAAAVEDWQFKHGRGLNRSEIRKKLMKGKEPEMRRLLGFVGVENYRHAGGVVVEDFFGEGGNVKDMKLLKRLANDAMDIIRRELEAAGWSWTEMLLTEAGTHHGQEQIKVKPKFTSEERGRVKEIDARLKVIQADEEGDDDLLFREQEVLEQEKELIQSRALLRSFDAKQKAKTGVIVSLTASGDVLYNPGVVRKEEAKPKAQTKAARPAPLPREPDINDEVEEKLDEIQNKALNTLLLANPREAFALFLAAGTQGMYGVIDWQEVADGDEISNARSFAQAYDQLKKLPVEKLLARLVAAIGRAARLDGSTDAKVIIEAVGEKALQAEYAKAFDPKLYAGGATTKHLLGIIAETRGEAERKAMEKADDKTLKLQAAEACRISGWLPPALRTRAYAAPSAKKPAAKAKKVTAKKKGGK